MTTHFGDALRLSEDLSAVWSAPWLYDNDEDEAYDERFPSDFFGVESDVEDVENTESRFGSYPLGGVIPRAANGSASERVRSERGNDRRSLSEGVRGSLGSSEDRTVDTDLAGGLF